MLAIRLSIYYYTLRVYSYCLCSLNPSYPIVVHPSYYLVTLALSFLSICPKSSISKACPSIYPTLLTMLLLNSIQCLLILHVSFRNVTI
jgi:hypothetical protein